MMAERRLIAHPGPPAAARCSTAPCRATPHRVRLQADVPLLDAMVNAVGAGAAWFDLSGLEMRTMSFVRPAPAPGDGHAAWYSATTTLDDARIDRAGVHLGHRDGQPFAHVHGIWSDTAGRQHMGHLLPENSILRHPVDVDALLLDGARLESADDPETLFQLFRPVATQSVADANAVLATIRPNETIDVAIAAIAADAGMRRASIKGLGSLVGAVFVGTNGIASYASEVLLTDGRLSPDVVHLDAAAVGFDGPHVAGPLATSRNAVCVTFEILVVKES